MLILRSLPDDMSIMRKALKIDLIINLSVNVALWEVLFILSAVVSMGTISSSIERAHENKDPLQICYEYYEYPRARHLKSCKEGILREICTQELRLHRRVSRILNVKWILPLFKIQECGCSTPHPRLSMRAH